jgi:hypothetical protein
VGLLASSSAGGITIVYVLVVILDIAGLWMVFSKAGRPGWAAIIPFYNTYTMCKIAGKSGWWLILLFIPLVNIIVLIILMHAISKAFGHGAGFTVGLVLLPFIFIPILGFGSSQYRGAIAPRY